MLNSGTSIRKKLRNVILTAALAVLFLTAAAFVSYEIAIFRKSLLEQNSTVAQIIASNATSAVTFEDEADAAELLSSLKGEPYVEVAALYNKAGLLFAAFPTNQPAVSAPPSAPAQGTFVRNGKVILTRDVVQNGIKVGTFYLQSTMQPLYDRMRVYVIISTAILIGSVLVAILISFWLEKKISYPVLALSNAAKTVTETRDYSFRAKKLSVDEIGLLTDSFNEMLREIELRDSAVRQSTERLQLALESSKTGVWEWEVATDKFSWDEFVPRLFGIKSGQFGGTFEAFLCLAHPEDRENANQAIRRAIKTHGDFVTDFRTVWPDQSVHYIVSRGRAIYDDRGFPLRVVGVVVDISESKKAEINLRESEERFRTMADAAPVLIWTSTPDNRRDYVNRAWLEFTGRPAEHELGFGWAAGIHDDDRAAALTVFKSAPADKQPFSIEYRLRRADGQYRWVHDHGAPRFGQDGSFQGFIGSCIDINERKTAQVELEQRVQDRTSELQASNKELEAFTYSVSHDLRAPLRHIDGYAQILQEEYQGSLPEDAHRYLRRIRMGTQNMGRLVDDLLNLARVGRQELATQLCDLNEIVQEALEDIRNDTRNRSIEWKIGKLPLAECDPGLIKQVFATLISNAAKYSRPREVAIIELGTTEQSGKTAIFVKDNGVGFSMKYASKLFGVFQRLHRAEDFEGTGVGLATVERIIRKHGGRIWAEAEVDHGATFFFTLPKIKSDS
jgi:PAS domain S-box-containing protein